MKHISKLIVGFSLALAACGAEQIDISEYLNPAPDRYAPDASSHPEHATYQAFLDSLVEEGLTGVAVSLRDSSGSWSGAAGWADPEHGAPLAVNSVSRVGSVSKLYTAVVILSMVEDGQLSLSQSLADALAQQAALVPDAGAITIADLLRHSSGIPDYASNPNYIFPSIQCQRPSWSREELLALSRELPRSIGPSGGFEYSNTNYLVLQMVAERVSGQSFERLLRERVSRPLGFGSTFAPAERSSDVSVIPGYVDFYGDGWLTPTKDKEIGLGYADGGITSTTGEMAAFIEALFADPGLLSGELLAEMTEAQEVSWFSEDDENYGLGLAIRYSSAGSTLYGHDGANLGYRARLWHCPARGRTLALLVNCGGGQVDVILERAFDFESSELMSRVFGP